MTSIRPTSRPFVSSFPALSLLAGAIAAVATLAGCVGGSDERALAERVHQHLRFYAGSRDGYALERCRVEVTTRRSAALLVGAGPSGKVRIGECAVRIAIANYPASGDTHEIVRRFHYVWVPSRQDWITYAPDGV